MKMKDDNFCMVCVAYMNQQSLFLASPLLPILNGRKMGVTWDLLRTCNGGRREVSLWLALPFDIVLHAHHLTIEYGIGELPYPVAENHKSA